MTQQELSAIGHCLSYLEGILLRHPEKSCEAIQKSLSIALSGYKHGVFKKKG